MKPADQQLPTDVNTFAAGITVCVVVKDRLSLMTRCLDGLARQTTLPGALVVVDNGSTDGTFEMLSRRAQDLPIPTTILRDLGSLGRIRNLAAQVATTPWLAFIDSDCVPTPDWLAKLAEVWATSADPLLVVVQGRTIPDPSAERSAWDWTQNVATFTRLFEACNISYLRTALLASLGFDEAIGFFGEDTAAGWHLMRSGGHAQFAPAAIVEHAVTPAGLRWHLRRARRYGNFCALVATFPEMRSDLLWRRYFLRRRNALAWLALVGLGLLIAGVVAVSLASGPVQVAGVVFVVGGMAATTPWVRMTRQQRGPVMSLRMLMGRAAFDLCVVGSLAIGSVRHRTLVL